VSLPASHRRADWKAVKVRRTTRTLIVVGGGLASLVGDARGVAMATTVPPTEPLGTVASEEQAAAEAALLVLTDFPEGWSEEVEEEPTEQELAYREAVANCAGGTGTDLLDLGGVHAQTGDFVGPAEQGVEQSVEIVDPTVAEDFMQQFGDPEVEACFAEAIRTFVIENFENPPDSSDSLPARIVVGEITLEPLELAPVADEAIGYRVTVLLSVSGVAVDSYIDIVAVRVGGSLTGITFQSVFEPFPGDERENLLTVAAGRLPR
jgi:hypothetical protein